MKTHNEWDPNRNPERPGESRIPVDTCLCAIDNFLKNEIIVAKVCSCAKCNYRRKMFRAIQEILSDYKRLKSEELRRHKK